MLIKPKVAIITPGTFPIPSSRMSSVERVALNVSQQLKTRVPLLICGKKTKGQPSYERDGRLIYLRCPYRNQRAYLKQIKRYLWRYHPSIIQVENRPRIARYFKRYFPHRPVWLSLHSTRFMTSPHIRLNELRGCLQRVDQVIVNSHFLKQKLLSLEPRIEGKIAVIHPGVDPQQFVPQWSEEGQQWKAEQLHALGYQDKRIILYAGRLIPIKGVHHLLEVMPAIIPHIPNVVLVIVGSAFYGKNTITPYVAKLHQLGNRMPHHVRFVPFVAYDEIQKWFSMADIVVVPSAENEAFGLVNVEAMASGIPVIATNAGGMKEIIVHGKTGFLLDPQHLHEQLTASILHLLSQPEVRRMMGEESMNRVLQHFTWQHTAEQYFELYHGGLNPDRYKEREVSKWL